MLFSGTLTEADRDHLHEKMVRLSCHKAGSDCWHYTGTKQTPSGIGVLRFRRRQFVAARIAAWLWCGRDFDLLDQMVKVKHRPGCAPDCINPEHLRVFRPEWVQPSMFAS